MLNEKHLNIHLLEKIISIQKIGFALNISSLGLRKLSVLQDQSWKNINKKILNKIKQDNKERCKCQDKLSNYLLSLNDF